MIKARELQAFMAHRSNRTSGEVDQRMRPLREAGVISSGPRGDNALPLTPQEAAYGLASMISRRAADALAVALTFMRDCKYLEHPRHGEIISVDGFVDGIGAGVVLALLLAEPATFDVHAFEISEDGRRAWLTLRVADRLEVLFFCDDAAAIRKYVAGIESRYLNQGASTLGSRMVFGGGLIDELALKLRDSDKAGYAPNVAGARSSRPLKAKIEA
jgi:hypothetical protein